MEALRLERERQKRELEQNKSVALSSASVDGTCFKVLGLHSATINHTTTTLLISTFGAVDRKKEICEARRY